MWLNGVRVLDLSRLLPGPFCTLLLADMGADVIKIEDTVGGDYARYYPPLVADRSAFFDAINRNKRSISVDLKRPEALDLFKILVSEADVVVESFRPGVVERLGIDHETVRSWNPRVVYASLSGYGQTGPLRTRAGHDINYVAKAGILDQNALPSEAPHVVGFQAADIGGALFASLGIVSALYAREKTGKGAVLDISLTEAAMSFGAPFMSAASAGGPMPRGQTLLTGAVPAYNVYMTADGGFLAVGALEGKFWRAFVEAIGLEELATMGLVEGEMAIPVAESVSSRIAERTLEEWTELLDSVDCCVEPVSSYADLFADPLHTARKLFFDLAGVRHVRTPLTPIGRDHTPAPSRGANTWEILEEAGVSSDTVQGWMDTGAIA